MRERERERERERGEQGAAESPKNKGEKILRERANRNLFHRGVRVFIKT